MVQKNVAPTRKATIGLIKRDFKDIFGFAPDEAHIHKLAKNISGPIADGSRSADRLYTKQEFVYAFKSLPNGMQKQLRSNSARTLYAHPEPLEFSRKQIHQAIEDALTYIKVAA